MSSLLAVFGRAHPLLLHLPIGLLSAVALLQLIILLRRVHGQGLRPLLLPLAWATALSAVLAVLSGLALAREPGYGGELLTDHKRLGIAVAVGSVLVAVLQQWGRPLWARLALLATLGVLLPAGHFGAAMTHGEGFLTEPLRARRSAPAGTETAARPSYASHVAPLLQARCAACHGESKQKGKLALHTAAAVQAGGFSGPAVIAGDPAGSELLRRLRLPLEDEEHMPPSGKPQPSADEIRLLELWIAAGAPFEGGFDLPAELQALPPAPVAAAEPDEETEEGAAEKEQSEAEDAPPAAPAPAAEGALAALRARLVHVQPLEDGSPLLWIDFAAPAGALSDAEAAALLAPVRAQAAELSLARVAVGEQTLQAVAGMAELRRLDLRAAGVTDSGLALLRGLPKLEHLVLVQNQLSDAAADTLAALPALRRAYLWSSGLSAEAVARLRAQRPELAIEAGDSAAAAAQEAETEVALSSDAPLPGQENLAPALAPVNAACPVTGNPVNPKYSVVFEGRVVGFCCPNCPKEFWGDPEQFRAKLP